MQDKNSNLKTSYELFERVEQFKYLGATPTNQNSIDGENEQIEVRECLLSFGAESFVFQFAIRKCKD